MEGDDLLLAEMEVKVAPKRDEWMTTLPPERKVGSCFFHSIMMNVLLLLFLKILTDQTRFYF